MNLSFISNPYHQNDAQIHKWISIIRRHHRYPIWKYPTILLSIIIIIISTQIMQIHVTRHKKVYGIVKWSYCPRMCSSLFSCSQTLIHSMPLRWPANNSTIWSTRDVSYGPICVVFIVQTSLQTMVSAHFTTISPDLIHRIIIFLSPFLPFLPFLPYLL